VLCFGLIGFHLLASGGAKATEGLQHPSQRLGQGRVGGRHPELFLPQLHVAARQRVEIG